MTSCSEHYSAARQYARLFPHRNDTKSMAMLQSCNHTPNAPAMSEWEVYSHLQELFCMYGLTKLCEICSVISLISRIFAKVINRMKGKRYV